MAAGAGFGCNDILNRLSVQRAVSSGGKCAVSLVICSAHRQVMLTCPFADFPEGTDCGPNVPAQGIRVAALLIAKGALSCYHPIPSHPRWDASWTYAAVAGGNVSSMLQCYMQKNLCLPC